MDPTKTRKNNRKMNPFHRCYVKEKASETQHFCGYRGAAGMKLGFTVVLITYDAVLDLREWNTLVFRVLFNPTYSTNW